jgi:hypothetical protein
MQTEHKSKISYSFNQPAEFRVRLKDVVDLSIWYDMKYRAYFVTGPGEIRARFTSAQASDILVYIEEIMKSIDITIIPSKEIDLFIFTQLVLESSGYKKKKEENPLIQDLRNKAVNLETMLIKERIFDFTLFSQMLLTMAVLKK